MKRIIFILVIISICAASFVCTCGAAAVCEPEKEIVVVEKGDGATNFMSSHGGEYAILTPEIPAEKVLYALKILGCPTWGDQNGQANVEIDVYKWVGDYDKTIGSKSIYNEKVTGHKDCDTLTITFGATALRYGYRYLIVFHAYDKPIGYWDGAGMPDGWEFYGNLGSKLDKAPWFSVIYAKVGDLGPEPTEEPTSVPTEAPTVKPTEEPAETATREPEITAAPEENTEEPQNTDSEGGLSLMTVAVICMVVAAVFAAVVIVYVNKKR